MSEKKQQEIAVIGSPSSTDELILNVLENASLARLVGSLVYFPVTQEGQKLCVTGQITSLEMRNAWHEKDVFKNIIKRDQIIPHLSGSQDIRTATLAPAAVFGFDQERDFWTHDVLGTVPSSGTVVHRLDQIMLDKLVEEQKDNLFYFGRAYGDDTVKLPMYIKHFGNPASGGQGEAYHSLIVGKTGSGKSTLAKYLLAGYARHKDMAILIVDPKGEFADEIHGLEVGTSGLPFMGLLNGLQRRTKRFGITQVRLEGYELFEDVLLSLGLDSALNIRGADNKLELATAVTEIIRNGKNELALTKLTGRATLSKILALIKHEGDGYIDRIYKGKDSQDTLRKEIEKIEGNEDHRIWGIWDFLSYLFADDGQRQTIGQICHDVMASAAPDRPLVVLDLSVSGNRRDLEDLDEQFSTLKAADQERDLFTDSLQKKIVFRITAQLRRLCETIVSERTRKGDRTNVNTLVMFEEAHRFAPRNIASDDEDGKKLKAKLVEAVRETRKYGLGWLFLDQTVGGLDKEIIQQIRCSYIGYGLSMGEELNAVREMVGGDQRDVSLYRSFKDPASYGRPNQKKFPWMAFGPVSPMAANHPLFFTAFSGPDFVSTNNLPVDANLRFSRQANIGSRKRQKQTSAGVAATLDDLTDFFLENADQTR